MLKKIFISLFILLLKINICAGGAVEGVTANIPQKTGEKAVYLTLDACGEGKGAAFDKNLITFLVDNNIRATLFLSGKWINKNRSIASYLAKNPLFLIGNHGTNHVPASVNGLTVYGIKGTSSKDELLREISENASKIENLTGKPPLWFRSGTAYYDRPAIDIITKELKLRIAGFMISADEGATLPAERVYANVIKAKSGDIIIAHMNHPESGTAEGLKKAIVELIKEDYVFKLLPDTSD